MGYWIKDELESTGAIVIAFPIHRARAPAIQSMNDIQSMDDLPDITSDPGCRAFFHCLRDLLIFRGKRK
jgi:hypothetical protein